MQQGTLRLLHGGGAEDAFSYWYSSPTLSVEGAGNESWSAAVSATFWLALVKVGGYRSACSFIKACPASCAVSCWIQLANIASTSTHSPVSLPQCYMVLCFI
jgi:hypothetical protein